MSQAGGQQLWAFVLALGFAVGMLLHEMIMEALFRLPDLPQSIVLWSGVAEFGACALIPLLLDAMLSCTGGDSTSPVPEGPESTMSVSDKLCTKTRVIAYARGWTPYILMSMATFVATTASTQSGRYVDYTVKVVFKCSKLLPTMLNATLMGNSRKFSTVEYVAALCLCMGTAVFSSGEGTHGGKVVEPHLLAGVICLLMSVTADGVLPNMQQRLMRNGARPNLVMGRTNTIGALVSIFAAVAIGGTGELIAYSRRIPSVLPCLVGVGLTLAFSIMCQVRLIKVAGSVVAVGVSTLRKGGTIALSFMMFSGKEFGVVRAVGLVFVAIGLLTVELKSIKDKKDNLDKSNKQNQGNAHPLPADIESQVHLGQKSYIEVEPAVRCDPCAIGAESESHNSLPRR